MAHFITLICIEIVNIVRCRAFCHTKTVEQVVHRHACEARHDGLLIASLALQVAREALLGDTIRIIPKRALRNAIWSTSRLTLPNDRFRHVVRCKIRTLSVALTVRQEGDVRLANKAVSESCAVTELARWITSYVSNLDVLMPFASNVTELSILILGSPNQLNICEEHSLITFSKVKVSHCKVSLVDVLNANCCNRRRSDTERVHGVDDS